LSLIQLVFCLHSHKETFTILYYTFTNFFHSSIIIIIIERYYLIQDFCLFFCLTSSIHLSITLYTFLIMISHSYNKHYHSTYIRQFVSKSSCIDRFISVDDSEHLNIKSLIENLKNMIMKKLSVLYVTESSVLSSTLSISFSATFSRSSTLVSVSDSPAPAISVLIILTFTTSASATSALSVSATASTFITSSFHFKEILYRLNELYFSVCILSFFLLISRTIYYTKTVKDICVFRNRNMNVILFYIYRCETYTS
ncbi:hypothetical protein BDBG_16960, partial [Blastomyces gilchristii SLH14081]